MSSPSGFMQGMRIRITSSRIFRISSESSVATRWARSGAICAGATSVAWSPASIQTTAFPSREIRIASSSGISAWASARAFSRCVSSAARFSGEEMKRTRSGLPRTVSPISRISTRSLAAASCS